MNKMISFRELIDLEPKPKKVKYNGDYYEYSNYFYYEIGNSNSFLESDMTLQEMKEPNIEIIEEDKPLIEKLNKGKLALSTYNDDILLNKINEIIDYINKKETE